MNEEVRKIIESVISNWEEANRWHSVEAAWQEFVESKSIESLKELLKKEAEKTKNPPEGGSIKEELYYEIGKLKHELDIELNNIKRRLKEVEARGVMKPY